MVGLANRAAPSRIGWPSGKPARLVAPRSDVEGGSLGSLVACATLDAIRNAGCITTGVSNFTLRGAPVPWPGGSVPCLFPTFRPHHRKGALTGCR